MHALLAQFRTIKLLGLELVDAPLDQVVKTLAERPSTMDFAYIVTPNADHFVRLARQREQLMPYYVCAGALLLDSRVIRRLGRILGLRVPPVVTGSDLTEELFKHWIPADEPVTIIGTTLKSVRYLTLKYSLTKVSHFAPPFGFESDPALIEQCVQFVCTHPARFIFFACGAPRQELLAQRIAQTGTASGIGLCIGAAIDQIGGVEKRAPAWLRHAGFEWSWRILREPKRMGLRYLQDLAIILALIRERLGIRATRQSVR